MPAWQAKGERQSVKYLLVLVWAVGVQPTAAQESRLSLQLLTSEAIRNNPEIVAAQKSYFDQFDADPQRYVAVKGGA